MVKDPAIVAHQEWIGYVQPTGLVVSIPALVDASAFLNRNYGPDHQRFLSALPPGFRRGAHSRDSGLRSIRQRCSGMGQRAYGRRSRR
jgi:hypothetical protein